ncbi:hypothetical protein HDU92_007754 [Lobulomyces angularis]|nr:hypothetical protein HDU92_007754 [Lobulomyces angularis]
MKNELITMSNNNKTKAAINAIINIFSKHALHELEYLKDAYETNDTEKFIDKARDFIRNDTIQLETLRNAVESLNESMNSDNDLGTAKRVIDADCSINKQLLNKMCEGYESVESVKKHLDSIKNNDYKCGKRKLNTIISNIFKEMGIQHADTRSKTTYYLKGTVEGFLTKINCNDKDLLKNSLINLEKNPSMKDCREFKYLAKPIKEHIVSKLIIK